MGWYRRLDGFEGSDDVEREGSRGGRGGQCHGRLGDSERDHGAGEGERPGRGLTRLYIGYPVVQRLEILLVDNRPQRPLPHDRLPGPVGPDHLELSVGFPTMGRMQLVIVVRVKSPKGRRQGSIRPRKDECRQRVTLLSA